MCAKRLERPAIAVLAYHAAGGENIGLRASADERQSGRAERELEQAPSERRYIIVVTLGRCLRDNLDLPIGQPEAPVHIARRGILRFRVRKVKLGWTRLENHVAMRGVGDLCEALRRQHHGGVLLTQGPQPLLDFCAERAIGQHDPGFVEDDERRPAVQALIDAVEQIGDDGNNYLWPHRHQRLQLEGDERLFEQDITVSIEKASERTRKRKGIQTIADRIVLDLRHEIADRPLLARTLGNQFKCAPQCFALRRNQFDALKFEPVFQERLQLHPVGLIVNAGERLQWHLVLAEIEVLSAEGFGQNERRVSLVEEEDLSVRYRTEVGGDGPKRNALAAPGRTIDTSVTDVADMQVEAERSAAGGCAVA